MSKIVYIILFWAGICAAFPLVASGQTNETLTITTYYPSPYGIYRNLEVKRGLAIGNITGSSLGSMANLNPGQLFINNSMVLNALPTTPASSAGKAGQVIYVGGSDKMLKFHNGTAWVNATGGTTIIGLLCGTNNGKILSAKPTTNLCSVGTSSAVSGTGPWDWSCTKDGYSSPCTAYPVMCGSSSGKSFASAPTTNLCAVGTNTPVLGSGPWTWNCVIGTYSAPCSANKCVTQPHFPPKTCWVGVLPADGWHAVGCPATTVNKGCTTAESWGAGTSCTYETKCCTDCGKLCDYWAPCTATCTQDTSDGYSCP